MRPATHPLDREYFGPRFPPGRRFQVVGFGLNAVDWICRLPAFPVHGSKVRIESLERLGGGQVATAMSLCARYGLETRYVGRVGDDEIGRFSLETLRQEPMDLSAVEVIAGAVSQYAVILVDPGGERTILWDRDPLLDYGPGEVQPGWIDQGQLLHVDGHDQPACIEAARHARRAGMQVSIDVDKVQPGVEELLELLDYAVTSQNFACRLASSDDWREALRHLDAATPGVAIVTRGRQGSAIAWQGEVFEAPGFEVTPVDTTGAGDVFHGAFAYALFQDWSVWRCLRFANAAGALATRRVGSRPGIPPREEVERLAGEKGG